MAQLSEQAILDALKGIIDPNRNQDIVSLGMVSGLAIKDGNVAFAEDVRAFIDQLKEDRIAEWLAL